MTQDDDFSFSDRPRTELDLALTELITHAQRVMSIQERLGSLLHAVQTIASEIELPIVLGKIVEAAVQLVDAGYGAIGVISSDGASLEQFIHVGLKPGDEARIGHLPRGRGLLGAVISHPHPIRLAHLAEDPRAAGFPANHPAMDSFLGVPVRVRGEVFGNLYLTNRRGGAFTDEDEQLLLALASAAGNAIQNARLLEEGRLRELWMQATAELSASLLSAPIDQALDLVCSRVLVTATAELVTVVVPDSGQVLRVAAARGREEESILGRKLHSNTTVAGRVLTDEVPVLLGPVYGPASRPVGEDELVVSIDGDTGSAVSVPMRSHARSWGALTITRLPRLPAFSTLELGLIEAFATQASLALELNHARVERQKAILNEERARIARDLHDHVIQQLFAAGLTVQSLAGLLPRHEERDRATSAVTQIDGAISQIRTVVFALSSRDKHSMKHRLIDVVAEMSEPLPRLPALTFAGPIDTVVDTILADEVVGVARELLSNAIRHSNAEEIALDVRVAANLLTVRVADDGGGIHGGRQSGLRNLRERAEQWSGTMTVNTSSRGTVVDWQVPVTDRAEEEKK